jgi:hypothetical protein
MTHEPPADAEVEGWLKAVGVGSLCQWDLLVFLYRHQTTLAGADHLARLLGYATEPAAALDGLESLGLVGRSRVSQGACLCQLTAPPEPPRAGALERLLALVGHRVGRLRLSERLRRDQPPRTGLKRPAVSPQEPRRSSGWTGGDIDAGTKGAKHA